jgi:hypothetical protein
LHSAVPTRYESGMPKKKNPAAVQLGSRGGKARAKSMSKEERTAAAKKMASALWSKKTPQQRKQWGKRLAAARAKAKRNRIT